MRCLLAEVVGCAPADLPLTLGPNGKPMLADGPRFNLSHAAGLAALVVTEADVLLGVDIEGARMVEPDLALRVFAAEELADLSTLSSTAREAAFFRGWTRKEAVLKATGEGLRADLKSFAVTLDAAPRLLRMDGDQPDAWRLHDFTPRADLAGAIACRSGGREISVLRRA